VSATSSTTFWRDDGAPVYVPDDAATVTVAVVPLRAWLSAVVRLAPDW
jgi:hypothetical protein